MNNLNIMGSFVLLFLYGCGEQVDLVRHYKERVLQAEPQSQTLSWVTPEAWHEDTAQSSGMRTATFYFSTDKNPEQGQCTIVVLPGNSGGVRANVQRWLRQLKINLEHAPFDAFLASQERLAMQPNLEGSWINFNPLQNDPQSPSMLAAWISSSYGTIFVKASGTVETLSKQTKDFVNLCQSLH